jgi:hypothetical protein
MDEKWEYKIIYCSAERFWTSTGLPADLNQRFDEFGSLGWELAGMVSIDRASLIPWGGSKTVGVLASFKRRVRS